MSQEANPHEEKGTTPWVGESEAIWNPDKPTWGIFSHWQCPHCGANLSIDSRICLNACGLPSRTMRRMADKIEHKPEGV
jgi:hypothetical protein